MSRILQVGSTGTVGRAVALAVRARGHELVTADLDGIDLGGDRGEGESYRVDITDSASIAGLVDATGAGGLLDAVLCTVGVVPFAPVAEASKAYFSEAVTGKLLSQLDLVVQTLPLVRNSGSFTLISGIMAEMPWPGGIGASVANGGVEAFVRAAAAEIGGDRRINAVSPGILAESVAQLGENPLPGHQPVQASRVGDAYVRSIEGIETAQIFRVR